MNTTLLLKNAKWGSLSSSEAKEIARMLMAGEGDLYELLLILGRAGAQEYRAVVEGFLERSDDPMLTRLALQVLCRYWGAGREYVRVLSRFARGVSWDSDDDVRLMALDCLGEEMRASPDSGELRYLLSVFEDESERQIVRETAYCAIARAVGRPIEELPSAAKHFDLRRDVDKSVLEEATKLI